MEHSKDQETDELSGEARSGVCPHCGNSERALLFQYAPTLATLVDYIEVIWGCTKCLAEWQESYPRPLHCKKQILTRGK